MSTVKTYLRERIAELNKQKTALIEAQSKQMAEVEVKVEQYRKDLTTGITETFAGQISKKDIEIAAVQASLDAAPDE